MGVAQPSMPPVMDFAQGDPIWRSAGGLARSAAGTLVTQR